MSMEFIAIISAGTALAGLIIGSQNSLRREMQEQCNRLDKRITEQGQKHSKEIAEQGKEIEGVKKEIEGVKIEVAALRATVETYFRVRVDPPQTAAVAEPPEDYGAD